MLLKEAKGFFFFFLRRAVCSLISSVRKVQRWGWRRCALKKENKKETSVSAAMADISVSGWGCCIILHLYRSFVFLHRSCVPTPPGFLPLRLSQTCWNYLVENKNTSTRVTGSTCFVLYFTSSLFSLFIFPVLCQIVNRQMEPFRQRDSCVNIELGSVDIGVHESDDHTWNEGSG